MVLGPVGRDAAAGGHKPPQNLDQWQEVRKAALAGIQRTLPASAGCRAFGELTLSALLEVIQHWKPPRKEQNDAFWDAFATSAQQGVAPSGSFVCTAFGCDADCVDRASLEQHQRDNNHRPSAQGAAGPVLAPGMMAVLPPTGSPPPASSAAATTMDEPTFWFSVGALELSAEAFWDPAVALEQKLEHTLVLPSGATTTIVISLVCQTWFARPDGRKVGYLVKVSGSGIDDSSELRMFASDITLPRLDFANLPLKPGHFSLHEGDQALLGNGSLRVHGALHLEPGLCKLELVRMWLRASGHAEGALSAVETLSCLRALAHGC